MNGFYEWNKAPKGTYQTVINDIELDVWQIGGLGWRFNALQDGVFLGFQQGMSSLDEACEAAARFAETFNRPRIKEVA